MKKLNNLTNKNISNSFIRFRCCVYLLYDVLMLFVSEKLSFFREKGSSSGLNWILSHNETTDCIENNNKSILACYQWIANLFSTRV